jgi:urease accessory protein
VAAAPEPAVPPAEHGWRARLDLRFAPRALRTALVGRSHYGPLRVQKPFYPEGGACHTYLLHPPGGVVGGDGLEIGVSVDAGGHALVTTPASAKFYRSSGPWASQHQILRVAAAAVLEWLPQDTILFDGSRVQLATRVELEPGATFVGWEVVCLGRPAAGEGYDRGRCRQHFELWRDGRPLLIDRSRFAGGGAVLRQPWGLAGHTVTGTLVAAPAGRAELEAVRAVTESGQRGLLTVTLIGDVLVARYRGDQGAAARQAFTDAWTALRPKVVGRAACVPRIWNT